MEENKLTQKNNVLFCAFDIAKMSSKLQNTLELFLGSVIFSLCDDDVVENKRVYFCGDVSKNYNVLKKINQK